MKQHFYLTHTFRITKLTQLISTQTLRPLAILAMIAGFMLLGTAYAQNLQLRYTFEDGPGTTTTDDPTSAIYPVTLNMVSNNATGLPVDLHGPANSGVQNLGHSLNLSANPATGNSGTQYYAVTTGNATLGQLGVVSNFTATVWFKMSSLVLNTVNNSVRFFTLATNGITDNGGNNTIGMNINVGPSGAATFPRNAIYLQLNNVTTVSAPIYYNFPTNEWLFVAMTYDSVSGNAAIYYGSEASPAQLYVVKTIGAGTNFNFSTAATLSLGNRPSGSRGFPGQIDEFRFYTGTGSASFIENIRQQSTPVAITGLVPDGSVLLSGTNTLTFTATSPNGVNSSGVKVLVNGADVSSSLLFSPTTGGQIVTYTNLPVNPTLIQQSILDGVNVTISVTDAGGIVTSNSYVYDAFSPLNFTWECEDYDFGGGFFIDNPVYTFVGPGPNTYYQEVTNYVNLTDANDNGSLSGPSRVYRDPLENVETEYSLGGGNNGGNSIGELMRQKVLDAYAVTNIARDVNVGYFDGGTGSGLPNWMNYTRTYPAGAYNAYLRVADGAGVLGTGPLSASFDEVTSGQGSDVQTITNIGVFNMLNTGGWDTFAYVPLRDVNGNLVRVTVPGVNTLRLTAGLTGGGNVNFIMLVPANTNLPTISNIYPNGTNMFQPAAALTFTASSPANVTINPAGISVKLTSTSLSGLVIVTNLTTANGGLVVTGTSTSRNVSVPLVTNDIYTAVINVTDVNGSPASSTVSFDTLSPSYTWEAPDYDYNSGLFIPDPIPVDGYSGLSGTAEIDYHYPNATAPPANNYRDSTIVGVENNSDSPLRLQFITNSVQPYDVGYYNSGNWLNYTRSFPAGQYNIFARIANGSGGGGGVTIAQVTGGQTTITQTTTNLGTISVGPTGGWQTYAWAPMRDGNGNLVKFTGGSTETLKATATGSQNVFFYALFPANTNLPTITGLYPDGTAMFQRTNVLAFGVTSSVGVSTGSIVVTLNGVVVSNLVFTGSSLSWTVKCPLLLDSPYTAAISVTDVSGNSASASVSFDTFSAGYYTWEGEDFDYEGGQFFDNPQTNAYFGLPAETDVDAHQVNFNAAAPYLYRTNSLGLVGDGNGMSTEINGDLKRAQYLGVGNTNQDYSMGYFSGGANTSGSFANYTRHYPAGSYNVYGRLASGGGVPTQNILSQVTGGWGTTTQTTNFLGVFNVQSTGWESYTFVPLRDNSGNLVTMSFNGSTNTLQLLNPVGSGADVNVNFFMLVPSGGSVKLTASISGGKIIISFPTQSLLSYQLLYKNNITDPGWTPVGSPVIGNGAIESFNQPASGGHQFYVVQVQ
jgi:hypothetical protein